MDPLGTITVYFPLIDDDTRFQLEEFMKNAVDYYDFVNTLTKHVLEIESSDLVVYFAIHHAAQLLDLKTIDLIGQKYSDVLILQPNIGFARHFQGKTDDFETIIQAADRVLAMNPEEWLALEMRFMTFEAETYNYPNQIQDSSNMEQIRKMIDNDPRFKFYDTVWYNNLARIAEIDNDYEEWNRCNGKAIENARLHDDQIRLAYCLIEQVSISVSDRVFVRKLLEESLEIMDNLGSIEGYASVLSRISSLEMIRGEFSSAIENYLKVVSILESLDSETGFPALMLASLYNSIGEYESGLEWGIMAEVQQEHRPFQKLRAVLSQVWSLIMLERIPEAEILVDSVHESILKSGIETNLGWLKFVTGLLEFTKGEVIAAVSSIEESLKIFEANDKTLRYRNMALYYLAKIELAISDEKTEVFPYLALLEETARQENLPGILGKALLLKSNLALMQNDDAILREVLPQLESLSKEPGLSFLLPFVETLIDKI